MIKQQSPNDTFNLVLVATSEDQPAGHKYTIKASTTEDGYGIAQALFETNPHYEKITVSKVVPICEFKRD